MASKTLSFEDIKKIADKSVADVQKRFGDEAVYVGGSRPIKDIDSISTGSLSLDIAIGVGGLPCGRIVEIYGPEGSGKTTICLSTIAQAQATGGLCAFIDMEHSLDPHWATTIGVDFNELYISQPDTGEQALEIAETFIQSGAYKVVVIDSVAALVPRAEIEGEMGASHVGLQARLMSQALRKLAGAVKATNTLVIFTNQLREKIGVMFGSPEITSGGRALKFYASVRLDIRRKQQVKEGAEIIGSGHLIKVKKNKVSSPFKEAPIEILYKEGIAIITDIANQALDLNYIDKRGAWYKCLDEDGNEIFNLNGMAAVKKFLRKNTDVTMYLHNRVLREYGMNELEDVPVYAKQQEANDSQSDLEVEE